MKKIVCLFSALVLFLCVLPISVAAEDSEVQNTARIESVDVYLPEVYISVYGSFDGEIDAKASLDGEELKFTGAKNYDGDSVSTCIYVLADISGSVSHQMYASVKSSMKSLIKSLGAAQIVKFYTFSQNMEKILDGTESYDEACRKLDETDVTGNGFTALYDSLFLIHD